MNMKELYETVTKAHQDKEAKYIEHKKQKEQEKRSEFKDVQHKFVEHVTSLAEKKIVEVANDPTYLKKFVDVFQFKLPSKANNPDDNVEFEGQLLITIMEGPKDSKYLEYFESLNTEPTIELLRKAFKPLDVHYGYLPKFGNVIQVRWDNGEVVPQWSLIDVKDFEQKKSKSQNNNGKHPNNRNNNRRKNFKTRNVNTTETMLNAFDMVRQMNMMTPRKMVYRNNNNTQVRQQRPENRKYNRGAVGNKSKYEPKKQNNTKTEVVNTNYEETEE
jgi:hypothetical protein